MNPILLYIMTVASVFGGLQYGGELFFDKLHRPSDAEDQRVRPAVLSGPEAD